MPRQRTVVLTETDKLPPNLTSADVAIGIKQVTIDLFGADTPKNRRRVYRMRSEVAPEQRLKGWIRIGRQVALVKSEARADIHERLQTPVKDELPLGYSLDQLLDLMAKEIGVNAVLAHVIRHFE